MKNGKYLNVLGERFYAAAPNLLLTLDLTTRFKWTLHDSLQAEMGDAVKAASIRATFTDSSSIDISVLED